MSTHSGGWTPIERLAAEQGKDFGELLEGVVSKLSGFTDDMCSAKRSDDVVYRGRKATWSNCAELVSKELGVKRGASCI